jgi:hypothetical protein
MLSISIPIAMCCDLNTYHSVRTVQHSAYQETFGSLLDANIKLFSGPVIEATPYCFQKTSYLSPNLSIAALVLNRAKFVGTEVLNRLRGNRLL